MYSLLLSGKSVDLALFRPQVGLNPFPAKDRVLLEQFPVKYGWSLLCWSVLYSAILRSRADSRRLHVTLRDWLAFYSAFFFVFFYISTEVVYLAALTWLVPHKNSAVSALSVYTIQPCTMSLHAKQHTSCAWVFKCNLPPQLCPEEIMSREVELGWASWTPFASSCPSCSSTAVQRTLS